MCRNGVGDQECWQAEHPWRRQMQRVVLLF